ncbi:type II toxin-antitoxin system RelE/ParE family toxin [Candidatus Uhrbacteria bacterium]|nr:type II toxin-antitoxin system RelE/ParE family toxin [Candidatus Uhrbacteria bacterium]
MRDLLITPQFEKDLKKISLKVRSQTDEIIKRLRRNPIDSSIARKKLHGFEPALWRVRIGPHRLVYSFTKTMLVLHRIRHRKDIYRDL